MEQLHRIRIKLKRFRYALQSVPELAPEARLLRSLKYLQDMLGLLHDDYINTMMVEKLVAAHPETKSCAMKQPCSAAGSRLRPMRRWKHCRSSGKPSAAS